MNKSINLFSLEKCEKNVYYDTELKVEAYRLEGHFQKFPEHFHDYYVCGYIESGERHMLCHGKAYDLFPGNIILFHPGEPHCCEPVKDLSTDYRALNISVETMEKIYADITGHAGNVQFQQNVILDYELAQSINHCYSLIIHHADLFEREEALICFLSDLIERYEKKEASCKLSSRDEILKACLYIEKNYSLPITLEELCNYTGLSHSALINAFTKEKGITPYKFLESIRLTNAKHLIEQNTPLTDVALRCGFIDQSHFSNSFKRLTGLTPGSYQKIFKEIVNE